MLLLLNLMSGGVVPGAGGVPRTPRTPLNVTGTLGDRTAAAGTGTSARAQANNPVMAEGTGAHTILSGNTELSQKATQLEGQVRSLVESIKTGAGNLADAREKLADIAKGSPLGRMIVTSALYDAEVNVRNDALDAQGSRENLEMLDFAGKQRADKNLDTLALRAANINALSVDLALGGLEQAVAGNKDATRYSKGLVNLMRDLQSLAAIASQPSAKDQLPQLRDSVRLAKAELLKTRELFLAEAPEGEREGLKTAFDGMVAVLREVDENIEQAGVTGTYLKNGLDIDLLKLKGSLANFTTLFANAVANTIGTDEKGFVTGDRLAKIAADEAKSAKTSAFVWTGLAIAATVVALVAVLVAASMVAGAVLSGGTIVALVASLPVTGPLGLTIAGAGAAALIGLYGKAIHSWSTVYQGNKRVERYTSEVEHLQNMMTGLDAFAEGLSGAGIVVNDEMNQAMTTAISLFDEGSPRAGEVEAATVSATSSAAVEPTLDAQKRALNRAAGAIAYGNPATFKDTLSKTKSEIIQDLERAFFNADNKETVVGFFNALYDDMGNKSDPWSKDNADGLISAIQSRARELNAPRDDEDEV